MPKSRRIKTRLRIVILTSLTQLAGLERQFVHYVESQHYPNLFLAVYLIAAFQRKSSICHALNISSCENSLNFSYVTVFLAIALSCQEPGLFTDAVTTKPFEAKRNNPQNDPSTIHNIMHLCFVVT